VAVLDWEDAGALAGYLAPVQARMRAAVAPREAVSAGLYAWLRYHLGWSDAAGRPEEARAAKGIRPLVALLAAEAVGGTRPDAVDVAAAVELTHEFSLIHDDLEDGDERRRGRPALWVVTGAAQAINAGDAMFAIAREVLSARSAPGPDAARSLGMLARYDRACLALAEGQFLDIGFEAEALIEPEAYLAMVRRKTGALLCLAAELGALAGGAAPAVADGLGRYGEALGVAFQMHDDVLGIWGDTARTGKPAGADLLRRKKSLPVVLGLADPELAPALRSAFSGPPERATAVALARRMEAAGLRRRASVEAEAWAERAKRELAALGLAAEPAASLAALAEAAIRRDR
jgi:geranylgeranyl diphosphate synthase type I